MQHFKVHYNIQGGPGFIHSFLTKKDWPGPGYMYVKAGPCFIHSLI
jgi:hypothetical protein